MEEWNSTADANAVPRQTVWRGTALQALFVAVREKGSGAFLVNWVVYGCWRGGFGVQCLMFFRMPKLPRADVASCGRDAFETRELWNSVKIESSSSTHPPAALASDVS